MSKFYSTNSNTHDHWLTPLNIIHSLGEFDLDPAGKKQHPTAKTIYDLEYNEDGLILPWNDRIFCNPPYSNWPLFLKKLSEHNNGIALIFARIETQGFFNYVWYKADSILFIKRRIKFLRLDGSKSSGSTCGSVLIAYGKDNSIKLKESGIEGKFIQLK